MNVLDIRPNCVAECSARFAPYRALRSGQLNAQNAAELLPERVTLSMVWRYIASMPSPLTEDPMCLCRKIVRWSGLPLSLGHMMTCLDIFADVGLLRLQRQHRCIVIHLTAFSGKADLNQSQTMQLLLQAKES
jgi:hypothetical protein